MKTTTIYGYENSRYFVCANNPHGHKVWFGSRSARDRAVEALEAEADARGLSDPHFARIKRAIRTESAWGWLDRLRERGLLLANGIDGPQDSPSHEWGEDHRGRRALWAALRSGSGCRVEDGR
jgi:hypothetical protein